MESDFVGYLDELFRSQAKHLPVYRCVEHNILFVFTCAYCDGGGTVSVKIDTADTIR